MVSNLSKRPDGYTAEACDKPQLRPDLPLQVAESNGFSLPSQSEAPKEVVEAAKQLAQEEINCNTNTIHNYGV